VLSRDKYFVKDFTCRQVAVLLAVEPSLRHRQRATVAIVAFRRFVVVPKRCSNLLLSIEAGKKQN
jgi:hypothetical protein